MRWRLSSRSAFACCRKRCARMCARATLGCSSARSPRSIPGSRSRAIRSFDPQHGPNTNVVLRARDAQKLAQAKREVEEMLERVRRAQSKSRLEEAGSDLRGHRRAGMGAYFLKMTRARIAALPAEQN